MVMFGTSVLRIVLAAYVAIGSNGFQARPNFLPRRSSVVPFRYDRTNIARAALPTPEESAQALTDYMTKAHEAKLKAVAEAESQKNAEIKALQAELESLRATRGNSIELASSQTILDGPSSTEDMAAKLASYQKFMADYVVKASEDKYRAVKEAEANAVKKYEAKVLLLSASAATATTAPPTMFDKRNANVVASAQAGKSRWGDDEVKRASSSPPKNNGTPSPPSPAAAQSTPKIDTPKIDAPQEIPVEVVAADHGLRADGGVDGLTLAERVQNGAKKDVTVVVAPVADDNVVVEEAVTPPKNVHVYPERPTKIAKVVLASMAVADAARLPTPTATTLFDKRNERVLAAQKAGLNYRWGTLETQKAEEDVEKAAASSPGLTITAIAEVEEADHGMRADGGVSGPSLLERVNLGAAILEHTS